VKYLRFEFLRHDRLSQFIPFALSLICFPLIASQSILTIRRSSCAPLCAPTIASAGPLPDLSSRSTSHRSTTRRTYRRPVRRCGSDCTPDLKRRLLNSSCTDNGRLRRSQQ
jgi:hypothetical protein